MKKLLVGAFVAGTFLLYSLHQRGDGAAKVIAPVSQVPAASSTPVVAASAVSYKDGQYTGKASNAFYGYIQVKATISGGKLTDVEFLEYPNDRDTSIQINKQAMPFLKQEAIAAQSANVDGVTGATDTSQAFIESLGSALKDAGTT